MRFLYLLVFNESLQLFLIFENVFNEQLLQLLTFFSKGQRAKPVKRGLHSSRRGRSRPEVHGQDSSRRSQPGTSRRKRSGQLRVQDAEPPRTSGKIQNGFDLGLRDHQLGRRVARKDDRLGRNEN